MLLVSEALKCLGNTDHFDNLLEGVKIDKIKNFKIRNDFPYHHVARVTIDMEQIKWLQKERRFGYK